MAHAWIIDTDHLFDGTCDIPDEAGTSGPRDADPTMLARLESDPSAGYKFRMHDDDGILYYSGRMLASDYDDESATGAPLHDFGMPNAGAVSISYPGRPDWNE